MQSKTAEAKQTDFGSDIRDAMSGMVDSLSRCVSCPVGNQAGRGIRLSGREAVQQVTADLVSILFPGCHGHEMVGEADLHQHLEVKLDAVVAALRRQIRHAFEYQCTVEACDDCDRCAERADAAVGRFLRQLPALHQALQSDITAAYEGDPAAKSPMEVVISYPGLFAVIVHRLAHLLYTVQVPLIPRIMSEYAHSQTGIDIHPGARIGSGFFIDHGTGVVIGETCVIGNSVKLYQGVTLGARSFEKDEQGRLVKGIKRHPNVEDNVVIYAGATILGGDTTIGAGSTIGGNVWLTHSVPAGSNVYNQQPKPLIRQADGRWRVAEGPWNDLGAGI